MKLWYKLIFYVKVLVSLALVFLGMYFAIINRQQVELNLIFTKIDGINLGLLSLVILCLGVLLGIIIGSLSGLLPSRKNDNRD